MIYNYKEKINKETNGEFIVLSDYVNIHTPVLYLHNVDCCMEKSWIKPRRFKKNTYKCPKCCRKKIAKKNLKTNEQFLKEIKDIYGTEYIIINKYEGSKTPIVVKHNSAICNFHEYSVTPNNFLRGSGCPKCKRSVSFPEILILLTILDYFPNAKKKKFNNRECDIFFTINNINIGIQYDGVFFHKDVDKDNIFNKLFLEKENFYLFRIREIGCPILQQIPRLYIIDSQKKYDNKNMSDIINKLFIELNKLLNKDYVPNITTEKISKAHLLSRKSHHYKMLCEEYITYLNKYKKRPKGRSENDLQGRYNISKLEKKFSNEEIKKIDNLLIKYGIIRKRLSQNQCIEKLKIFFDEHGFLPRQVSKNKEKYLYLDLKYYLKHNMFSEEQLIIYQQLSKSSSNNYLSNNELFKKYLHFVHRKKRLPGFKVEVEKKLNSMIYHRINRHSFSNKQIEILKRIKKYYSNSNLKDNIVDRYVSFVKINQRLPNVKGKDSERKLEKSILRFLNGHYLDTPQVCKLISIREKYLGITRRKWEYTKFLNYSLEKFIEKEYKSFCLETRRLPKKSYKNKEEQRLFKLVYNHLDINKYPLDITKKKIKQHWIKPKAADIIFEEAMNFYEQEGHFPLHVKKKQADNERPYEGKLAARITQCYRRDGFSLEQKSIIDKYRIKNKDKPTLVLNRFLKYIDTHNQLVPKHNYGKEEDNLLSSLKAHIKAGNYTGEQLRIINLYIKIK